DHVADHLRVRLGAAVGAARHVAESVEAELERTGHVTGSVAPCGHPLCLLRPPLTRPSHAALRDQARYVRPKPKGNAGSPVPPSSGSCSIVRGHVNESFPFGA